MGRTAVFASDANLTLYKCGKKCFTDNLSGGGELGTPEWLTYKEWTFHSLHRKMLDCKEMCHMAIDISTIVGGSLSSDDHIDIVDHTLKLPAIIFGNDILSLKYSGSPISFMNGSDDPITHLNLTENRASSDTALREVDQTEVIISIDARDALCCWAAQHTEEGKNMKPLIIVQVPCAESWNERSLLPSQSINKDVERSDVFLSRDNNKSDRKGISSRRNNMNIWDWTFTTDYCCSLETYDGQMGYSTINSEDMKTQNPPLEHTYTDIASPNAHEESKCTGVQSSDVVDSSAVIDTHFDVISDTFNRNHNKTEILSARYLSNGKMPLCRIPNMLTTRELNDIPAKENKLKQLLPDDSKSYIWRKTDKSGIDLNLLRMQNVPILFYDEILLYEDDLEDCGDVTFEAKLRVMPSCWFVLSRFFVRVDGTIIRIRDTRLFHRFGDKTVHMEITWKECSLANDLGKAPIDQIFSNAILRNPGLCSEKLPSINEKENIHAFFVLDLR